MIQAQYIVDLSNGYIGRVESVLDESGTVAYSGALYNQGGPNLTLEEYKQAKGKPHLVLVSSSELDDLERTHEASLKTDPTPITEEQYDYWLGCLPPSRWQHIDGCEIFHICERLRGNLVQWCFTKGGKYYGFTNDAALSVDALRAIINEVAA